MRITVKFFAILRDRAGVAETTLNLADGTTARAAVELLRQQFPSIADLTKTAAIAVNCDYAPADEILADGDELVLIPPVSGG